MTREICLIALACPLFLVGCADDSERRVALGGGALSPVKVTLLVEAEAEEAVTDAVDTAARITEFGTFRGRVVVSGEVPALRPLVAQGQQVPDAAVCSVNPVPDESVVIGPENGLANVFIYLRRVPNVEVPEPPADPVVLDQEGCKYVPHAFLCQVGQPIRLLNSDPVAHNVRISGTAMSFNQTLGARDRTGMEIRYERAERIPVKTSCDFHGWMSAWQLAIDHPWGALTGEDGTFEIPNAPATELEFIVWHEKAGYIDRGFKVRVPADGVAEHTFEVRAAVLAGQ